MFGCCGVQRRVVVCLVMVLALSDAFAMDKDLEVAPDGFSVELLSRRILAVRRENPSGIVRVRFSAGDYYFEKPLLLDGASAPSCSASIEFCSVGHVRLFGSVPVSGWKRGNVNGFDGVWYADVRTCGVTNRLNLLFCNGRRQVLARYPNADSRNPYAGGWAYVDGKRVGMYQEIAGERLDRVAVAPQDRISRAHPAEGRICIFPRYNWFNRIANIASVESDGSCVLASRLQFAARPGDRYHFLGYREDLDVPGEWYHDVGGGRLWWIPEEADMRRPVVLSVPCAGSVFRLEGASGVKIRGFEICAANSALVAARSCDVVVSGCRIHDVGFTESAVSAKGCSRFVVKDCDIWETGGPGVQIEGGGNPPLELSGNAVENCYLHHTGRMSRNGGAIVVVASGVLLRHNLIHDIPRSGIAHNGQLNVIAFNRIRHTNLESEDTAAVYGHGDWIGGAGTKIFNNWISDTIGFGWTKKGYRFRHFAFGLYTDTAGGGTEYVNNIVERSPSGGIHLNSARYCLVSNNVFVSNGGPKQTNKQLSLQGWHTQEGIYASVSNGMTYWHARLLGKNPGWTNFPSLARTPQESHLPGHRLMQQNVFVNNIVYYPDQPNSSYHGAVYFDHSVNRFDRNVIWGGSTNVVLYTDSAKDFCEWKREGQDVGSLVTDPLFVDPVNHDWRLRADSPARKLGIRPVSTDSIGLVKTASRRRLPVRDAEGVREHPEWLRDLPSQAQPERK